MPATRVYLVRHGATQLTAENRFSGAVGVELSDDGRWQAARLGERMQQEGITAIYSSPLSRTMDTARIIAGPSGLDDSAARWSARDQPRPMGRSDAR